MIRLVNVQHKFCYPFFLGRKAYFSRKFLDKLMSVAEGPPSTSWRAKLHVDLQKRLKEYEESLRRNKKRSP